MDEQLKSFIEKQYPHGTKNIDISIDYQMKIGPKGAHTIAQTICWDISRINLNMYFIQNDGMQAIVRAGRNWPSLNQILLQRNNISCQGLQNFERMNCPQLKILTLNKNSVKAKGFKSIVECDCPKLEVLELSHSEIGLQGAKMIPLAKWPNIQILNLNYNMIGNEGMRQISKCKWPQLKNLQLSNNKLDATAMYYLSSMELPKLKGLTLNRNQIGRKNKVLSQLGCVYISRIKVESLKYLHIFGNDITLNGIKSILYSGKLAERCFLEVIRNLFEYSQIQQDVAKLNLFCNVFG